jgi:hypothetical protein
LKGPLKTLGFSTRVFEEIDRTAREAMRVVQHYLPAFIALYGDPTARHDTKEHDIEALP